MGLLGGIKKLGRGLGTGFKQAGKGIGGQLKSAGKAFDRFDDWIKLKEIANVMQFVPGPQQAFFKPLAMTYAGFDTAKNLKEGNLMKAALSGASMYGSHKIKTSGFGGGAAPLGAGMGENVPDAMRGVAGNVGFKSQAIQNLKDFGGGASNPFGLMDKWQGLDKGSKFAIETIAPPILSQLQGGQKKPQGPIPSYGYQPMNHGPSQGFSPTSQFPTQAQGGITGDDWHQPINRLPANYEGWVTQPSLATLGEAGKEAVLPLNKLLPAMNKGGLNYSPGQAIVGEAGPEYVTRLGPGEEQYAQRILQERPMPQMANGGVAGEPSYWDQLRDYDWIGARDDLRDWGGRTGKDIMEWGSEEDPGEWKKRLMGLIADSASLVASKSMGALHGLGVNPWNLMTGQGEWFGETLGEGRLGSGRGALHGPGTPYKDLQEYERSRDAILDPLEQRIFFAEEGSEERQQAVQAYYEALDQIEAEERNTIGQMTAEQGGREVIVPPGMSEIEMVQAMQQGEKFPPVAGPLPPYVGPQGLDPALLDNYNAREWQRRAETSPEDKKRYEGMLQDLIRRQNEGEVFPTPTYSATALDKMENLGGNGQPTSQSDLTREQQLRRSDVDQEETSLPPWLEKGVGQRLDRYPSEEGANIVQPVPSVAPPQPQPQAPPVVSPQPQAPPVVSPQPQAPPVVPGQEQAPHVILPPEKTQYNPADIAQMLIQRGMDPRSAAHMAANIMQESGGYVGKAPYEDLSVSGRGGTSGGIVSWRDATVSGGGRDPRGRLTRIENHYGRKIQNITMPEQLDYMMKEMQEDEYNKDNIRYPGINTYDVLMNPNATYEQRNNAMQRYLKWGHEGTQRNPYVHEGLKQFGLFPPNPVDLDSGLAPNMQMAHKEATPDLWDSFTRWIGY